MYFAIVDDLETDRNYLISLIRESNASYRETVAFSAYDSSESFLADFRPGKFSAIFLDILMDGISGVEAARRIRERDPHISIIFTTTDRDYALDSYDVHALDYLIKPIRADRLAWCLKQLSDTAAVPLYIKIKGICETGTPAPSLLPLENILYAESIRNGLLIHTTDGDIRTGYTFTEFMRLLPDTGQFFECGRGLMVNFFHVKNMLEDGEIFLSGDVSVFSSRRKTKETRTAYADYQFSLLRKGE